MLHVCVIVMSSAALPSYASLGRPQHHVRKARQTTACASGRATGDANGDCVFDVVDAVYCNEFVVERLNNFTGTFGSAFTRNFPGTDSLRFMDADLNSVIDALDVLYLAKTSVGLTRFLTDVEVVPVQENNGTEDNGCVLRLAARVVKAGDIVDTSAADRQQTNVYFLLSSTSQQGGIDVINAVTTCA